MSNIKKYTFFGAAFLVLPFAIFILAQFELPSTTGPYTIGRTSRVWTDNTRLESAGPQPDKLREVSVEIWYPAKSQTGIVSPYFPKLSQLAKALANSGEISPIQVFLLRFVRSNEKAEAVVAANGQPYPVIILSPGNGTNVEFYSGIADELASYGYVVVGINHPYDVAATMISDGRIAQFNPGPFEFQAHEAWVRDRIQARVADVLFVLERLDAMNNGDDAQFMGALDMSRVGIMGHSLGGITSAQVCARDLRFKACLNYDGIQKGGPFSATEEITPMSQPFMFITKETEIAPAFEAIFAEIQGGSYRVTIRNARHDNFTDGPSLLPTLLPVPSQADEILALSRSYTVAFFEQTLRGHPSMLLQSSFEATDAQLKVYLPH